MLGEIRIQRLLRWAQGFGHVLEVHAYTGPCVESTSHGIDEHIGLM
jgi:hypothetical protein